MNNLKKNWKYVVAAWSTWHIGITWRDRGKSRLDSMKVASIWFEGSTEVIMKSSVFWNITSCSPLKFKGRVGETCRLHLQDRRIRAAAYQLRQDKHQDMRQKRQKVTSASWLRPVCGGFHNLIRFNCAPFFAPCRTHRVLTVTCLHACRCAAYLS
jgi:hypothetical protein